MQACAVPTPEADVDTEELLEASLMHNRTVYLGADIYLSSTFYVLIGLNEVLDFVLDGKGLWKLDGQDSVRCLFIVGSGAKVGLKDLSITNGYASESSMNGYYGGGIYVGDGAVLNVEGCTISSSRTATYGQGAGIYIDNAVVSLADTVIEFNMVYYGKGAGVFLASSSVVTINGGTINSNLAWGTTCYTSRATEGGGIHIDSGASATIINGASIQDNIAYKGGGVFVASLGELVLQNASITGNSYTKTYSETTYYAWYSSSCSTYTYESYGGGIFLDSNAKLLLVGSKVFSNIANYYGGGIYLSSSTSSSVSDSKFSSNYAYYRGGGIYSSSATIVMNNSDIISNTLAGTSSRYCLYSHHFTT